MKGRKKGGNFMQQQPQYQYQYQQQQPQYQYQYQNQYQQQQPQQQNQYGTMINDTMKNMQPVYDATAAIGIAYAIFTTVIATIICSFLIYFGVWIKNMDADKTAKAVGVVKDAVCNTKEKSCVATINYTVNNVEYSVSSTTGGVVNKGQNIDVYYDPKNPNNFSSNSYTYVIGWVIIVIAVIILLSSWGWLIMTIFFKPIAAASGVGAVAGALIPDSSPSQNFGFNNEY